MSYSKERPGVGAALRTALGALSSSYSGIVTDSASSALKQMKNNKGIARATSRSNERRLQNRSRKMAKDFQGKMEKTVKRKLDQMSGPDDNRKRGLKVSQFIPGKGLEVGGVQEHNDPAIYCSLGLKGDKIEDALSKTFDTMSGKKASIDFAFKLICKPDLTAKEKHSRATVLNCFRHVNPDSYNYKKTGTYVSPSNSSQVEANKNWHTTLGPDASYIRRGPDGLNDQGTNAGTWRAGATDIGGLAKEYNSTTETWSPASGTASNANSLYSPYRYPEDMEVMYSRVNRQVMENYGFSLNRFRLVDSRGFGARGDNLSTWSGSNYIDCYPVPDKSLMNFPETANGDENDIKNSFPAQINNLIKPITGDKVPSDQKDGTARYEYHSQFGPGKLNYQFSNDGTNPVCVDICVVGIKKGETAAVDMLSHIFTYNYQVDKFQNNQRMNVHGYQSSHEGTGSDTEKVDFDFGKHEWHSDAKLPFVPSQCFKNPQSYTKATDHAKLSTGYPEKTYDALMQGRKNPFKVVKRDQFIVSSGSSRSWNTTLPSINYRPQLFEDVLYPLNIGNDVAESLISVTADEYTFVLCIGASGMSKPMEELYPTQTHDQDGNIRVPELLKSTITDHEPSSCNVSVVGTYTETCMPAYPVDVSDKAFINGRLTLPYFTNEDIKDKIDPTNLLEFQDRLSTVDIATQMQVVRSSESGISGVGAINTAVGA